MIVISISLKLKTWSVAFWAPMCIIGNVWKNWLNIIFYIWSDRVKGCFTITRKLSTTNFLNLVWPVPSWDFILNLKKTLNITSFYKMRGIEWKVFLFLFTPSIYLWTLYNYLDFLFQIKLVKLWTGPKIIWMGEKIVYGRTRSVPRSPTLSLCSFLEKLKYHSCLKNTSSGSWSLGFKHFLISNKWCYDYWDTSFNTQDVKNI